MAFTAKFISKHMVNGQPKVVVEFSDGVTTVQESCIPQDLVGLKHWVKSRLAVFNTNTDIDNTFVPDAPIDLSEPEPVVPTPTQAELDEQSWRNRLAKMKWIQENLIATGVLDGTETAVVNLRNGLKTDFKAAYIQ